MDLTDRVKGRRQYLIRFGAGATGLAGAGLTMLTNCQANAATMPHLKDGGSRVSFLASGRAVTSAGPELSLARARVVEGGFGTPNVTMELASPRGEPALAVYGAAHIQSGNPPDPAIRYQIESSTDGGATWRPVATDWTIPRMGQEPGDFWSQSHCWGAADLPPGTTGAVRVRFRNDGGKAYLRCEAHLTYRAAGSDATEVTFAWSDDAGEHRASHRFAPSAGPGGEPATWDIPTGRGVRTRWVEFRDIEARSGN
jgi:hypothetical protein